MTHITRFDHPLALADFPAEVLHAWAADCMPRGASDLMSAADGQELTFAEERTGTGIVNRFLPTFFVTFGQEYPEKTHPKWSGADRDGWLEVAAPSLDAARELTFQYLGVAWAFIYEAADFEPVCYPKGRLGTLNSFEQAIIA